METIHNEELKRQFDLRSSSFERAAYWVTDPAFIAAHVRYAGKPGKALELCCGTGAVSRGLKSAGWDVCGIDISPGMVVEARKHIPAVVGDVAALPFADHSFNLVIMRQAFSMLENPSAVLSEVRRVLKPGGRFILSHMVPFSRTDSSHLQRVLSSGSAPIKGFHTTESLRSELENNSFSVVAQDFVVVRESVTLWMNEAPDFSEDARRAVCDLVVRAPEDYKQLRRVAVENGEIMEDWNFVLFVANPKNS